MQEKNFVPETKSIKSLFLEDYIYSIPSFQRDYSWDNTNSEWEDLWQDIISKEDEHYIGFIVIQSKDKKEKEKIIIDGQQRLVTISLIILAALSILEDFIKEIEQEQEKKEEKERLKDLIRDYIGKKDSISREFYNKLILNDVNKNFFKNLCKHLGNISQCPPDSDTKKKTNEKLYKAFAFYKNKINEYLKTKINGKAISSFIDKMATKIFFTIIVVNSDANAYILFETLNARGMKLAAVDLLKNFLYSQVSSKKEYLVSMKKKWENIALNISEGDLNKFIRMDWGTRNTLVSDRSLFKTISNSLKNNKKLVFDYTEELEKSSIFYSALKNYNNSSYNSFWKQSGFESNILTKLEGLNQLNLKQVYGILIAYLKNMPKNTFGTLVSWLEKISFRYNTISNLDAKRQEVVYNEISKGISSKEIKTMDDIKKHLYKVYIDKNSFINNFSCAESKTKKTINYIFKRINMQRGGDALDTKYFTIEHILCQSKNEDWKNFEEPENYIWRLGNLSLIEKDINEHDLRNKKFLLKKEIYSTIDRPIVKDILKYDNWTPKEIDDRQKELAKTAQEIWKIDDFEEK